MEPTAENDLPRNVTSTSSTEDEHEVAIVSTSDADALQLTRCLILLPNESFDPTGILRSFRRRPVEIEIYSDPLMLLSDLGRSLRNRGVPTHPIENDQRATDEGQRTIIFMVEPDLTSELHAFMSAVRDYFPQVSLLAHTEDPSVRPIENLGTFALNGRMVEEVATATAIPQISKDALGISKPALNAILDLDSNPEVIPVEESAEAPCADDDLPIEDDAFEHVFAPPSFIDENAEQDTANNQDAMHDENDGEEGITKDERLVSEEELAMLLGDGDFLFVDDDAADRDGAGTPDDEIDGDYKVEAGLPVAPSTLRLGDT